MAAGPVSLLRAFIAFAQLLAKFLSLGCRIPQNKGTNQRINPREDLGRRNLAGETGCAARCGEGRLAESVLQLANAMQFAQTTQPAEPAPPKKPTKAQLAKAAKAEAAAALEIERKKLRDLINSVSSDIMSSDIKLKGQIAQLFVETKTVSITEATLEQCAVLTEKVETLLGEVIE